MTKAENKEEQNQTEEQPKTETPENLTGSGVKQVKVMGNVNVMGVRPQEIRTLADSEELQANIENGNLTVVND